MRVFVTGGNGFIGSAVVRLLETDHHAITCLLRPTSKVERIEGISYTRVTGDIRSPEALRQGMRGCDGVIHLASISNWEDMRSPEMNEVIIEGTRNVLAAARASGIGRLVFVSSATTINGSRNPLVQTEETRFELTGSAFTYAYAKRSAEQLCFEAAATGLPVVIVNPTEVYGPGDTAMVTAGNLVDFACSRLVLVCRGGTNIVHIDDVARGILAAYARGLSGERYLLGGENMSIRQLAEVTLTLVGKRRTIVTVPNGLLRALAWCGATMKLPLPFNPAVVPYATRFWYIDASKATRQLGVNFRSAFDTLAPTVAWLRSCGRIS